MEVKPYQALAINGGALTGAIIYYKKSKTKKHKFLKTIGVGVGSGLLTSLIITLINQTTSESARYSLDKPTGVKILSVESKPY